MHYPPTNHYFQHLGPAAIKEMESTKWTARPKSILDRNGQKISLHALLLFQSVLELSGQYELQTIGNEYLEDFTVYLEDGMFKYPNGSQILTIRCIFFYQLLLKSPFRERCCNFLETNVIVDQYTQQSIMMILVFWLVYLI